MSKDTSGPAFPNPDKPWGTSSPYSHGGTFPGSTGMTMRDWFAGQFIAGIAPTVSSSGAIYYDRIATDAYAVADAMLKERSK